MTTNEFARLKRALKNNRKVAGIKSYYGNYHSVEEIKIDGNWIWVYYKTILYDKWITQKYIVHYKRVQKFTLE